MGVTHVLRAQEWLSSTPLHVILYHAFGWEPPEFCHLPMVVGEDGKKLSKRHGSTSIDEFREAGYLPDALINYVAMVGASYEDGRDIYTLDELARLFSLDKLSKASGVFDYKKLDWYNGQYIRMKNGEELARLSLPWAIKQGLFGGDEPSQEETARYTAAMPLVRERAVTLADIPAKLGYLFAEPPVPEAAEFFPKKADLAKTRDLLSRDRTLVAAMAAAESDAAGEQIVKDYAAAQNLKLGDLMMPLRVAITGSRVSPPLFGSMRLLGVDECLARVDKALAALETAAT
jgi:glutamyl-tRNA synthetase